MVWQVQEAKQRLSEVLRAAESGQPQVISRHGREVAVVIDFVSYQRLRGVEVEVELGDFLRRGPAFDDLELERSSDLTQIVDLGREGVRAE